METTHFYIALFFHLIGLITGFGAVLVIDTFGLLMLLGKQNLSMVKKVARITQALIWIGWTTMVISGINLIWLKGYVDNLTKIKIFFVLMLGLNGIFLHLIKEHLQKIEDIKIVKPVYFFRIALTSAISQTGWWGALLIGFVHRHIQHNIIWPKDPYIYIYSISGFFFCSWVLGELYFKFKK